MSCWVLCDAQIYRQTLATITCSGSRSREKHFCKLLHFTSAAAVSRQTHETKCIRRCCAERTPIVCTAFCLFCSHLRSVLFPFNENDVQNYSRAASTFHAGVCHQTNILLQLISHGDIYGRLRSPLWLSFSAYFECNRSRMSLKIAKMIRTKR